MNARHSSNEAVMAPPPAMRPFHESLPMALLQAREAAMKLFRPMLAEHGLTEQQWRVLRALAASDVPLDAGALADQTFLLGPSLSRMLASLDDKGIIERSAAPDDQRRSLITLSAAGLALVREVAPQSEHQYRVIEERFGADRLADLISQLHSLAEIGDVDDETHHDATNVPTGGRPV